MRESPAWGVGELSFLSVIEEECTGNGTLAACRAGVLGDAAVLLEPTDPGLLLGGTGIVWAEIEIDEDHPLVTALAAAHADAHGEPPPRTVLGSTTDARYYLNQFGVPAVVYGPPA